MSLMLRSVSKSRFKNGALAALSVLAFVLQPVYGVLAAQVANAAELPLSVSATCDVNHKVVLTATAQQAELPNLPSDAENWSAILGNNIKYTTDYGTKSQTLTAGDVDTYTANTNQISVPTGTVTADVNGLYSTPKDIYVFGFKVATVDEWHSYSQTLSADYDALNCDTITAPSNVHISQGHANIGVDAATNHTGGPLWFEWDPATAVSGISKYTVYITTPDGQHLSQVPVLYSDPYNEYHMDLTGVLNGHGEGLYTITVKATSNTGLELTSSAATLVYDHSAPLVSNVSLNKIVTDSGVNYTSAALNNNVLDVTFNTNEPLKLVGSEVGFYVPGMAGPPSTGWTKVELVDAATNKYVAHISLTNRTDTSSASYTPDFFKNKITSDVSLYFRTVDGLGNVDSNYYQADGTFAKSKSNSYKFTIDNVAPTADLQVTGGHIIGGDRYVRPGDTIKYKVFNANDVISGLNRASYIVTKLDGNHQVGTLCGNWPLSSPTAQAFTLGSSEISGSLTMKSCNGGVNPDDGRYGIGFGVFDIVENRYRIDNSVVYVDGTKPELSNFVTPTSTVSKTVSVSVAADDPIVNGVASGVTGVKFYIAEQNANGECKNNLSAISSAYVADGVLAGGLYSASIDTSALDGNYCVLAVAEDGAMNHNTPLFRTVSIDNTAPKISIVNMLNGQSKNKVDLNGKTVNPDLLPGKDFRILTDEDGVLVITFPDGTQKTLTVAQSKNNQNIGWALKGSDGKYQNGLYTFVKIDAVDNESSPVTVTIDTVAPDAPTLTSPANGVVTNGASITQSWSDASSDVDHYIYESYNDSGATSLRWHEEFSGTSKTATNVANATYYWRVKAVDQVGNESPWSSLWKVVVDNDAPVVSFSGLTDGATYTSAVDLIASISDANLSHYFLTITKDGANYAISGVTGQSIYTSEFTDKPLTTLTDDGSYTVKLEARDKAGNKDGTPTQDGDSVKTVSFTIDTVGPNITGDETGVVTGAGTIQPSLTDNDGDQSGNTYKWTQVSGPAADISDDTALNPVFTPTGDGTYIFELTATDHPAGNVTTKTFSFTYTKPVVDDNNANQNNGGSNSGDSDGDNNGFSNVAVDDGDVQGATDDAGSVSDDDGGSTAKEDKVAGAATHKTDGCFKFLGVCWYYWIPVVIVVIAVEEFTRRKLKASRANA